ncbi:YvrJ family protein, partial [Anoxybacillus flavithermus]
IYLVFKHESGAGNHQKKGCMDHISIELTPKSKLISNHHGFRIIRGDKNMETITNTPIETFIKAIGNFGFPLVLAVYLLLRFEKKIESLTEAINQLQQVIKK